MTEHPGEQFPPDVDPDVEPGSEPDPFEETPSLPDYDTEPGAGKAEHVDRAEVEFGPEFARAPGKEYEHDFEAGSAEDPGEGAYGRPTGDSYEGASTQGDDDSHGNADSGDPGDGGHPLVEDTMSRLDELRDRPVSEHSEVYADLHERLQSALVEADAEQGDRA